jgi:hypothetical protein
LLRGTAALIFAAAAILAAAAYLRPVAAGPPWHPVDDGAHLTDPRYGAALRTAHTGEYAGASQQFRTLAGDARGSSLAAWSLLQAGICEQEASRQTEAKAAWETLRRDYPRSHVAGLAEERLERLEPRKPPQAPVSDRDPHCGPKALARACQALAITTSLPELVRLCNPGPHGSSFEQLAQAARKLGLRAEGVKVNAPALRRGRPSPGSAGTTT